MRASIVKELGGPDSLIYVDNHQIEKPGPNRILIDVAYAGVNFPDILITQGKYQFQPELPFAPGGEVAGTIKEVGEGVSGFAPGDRIVGGTTWGGFAEQALGFDFNAHKLPDSVSFRDASAILMTHGTVIHALKDRAKLKAGETLVVLGASGGVGTATIQIGKLLDAHVVAFTSTDEKVEFCKEAGADEAYTYSLETLKAQTKAVNDGKGADVIFDPIGGDYSEQAFRGIAPLGRHLVIGFAAGNVPAIPWNLPLLKSASIVGVFWGSFFRNFPEENNQNIQKLLKWVESGELLPLIDAEFSLEDAPKALKMLQNRQVKGKVILNISK